MTPIFQHTKTDCFKCCLATIFDLPYEEVPDFCQGDNWFQDCNNWLKTYGMSIVEVISKDCIEQLKIAIGEGRS